MRALTGPEDLVEVVADRFGAHPWARLCAHGQVTFAGGWDLGDAVGWRSGHPWAVRTRAHALGAPDAAGAALAAVRQSGEDVVVPAGTTVLDPALGSPSRWSVRMRAEPCPPQAGEETVRWLDDAGGVGALLEVTNPHAAVRPGDALAGRWCGTHDESGLVACAVETMLAAPRGHLSSLAVHPRARRRGLGAAVTAWFVRTSLAEGAPEVMLAVDEGNDAAHRLYDRLGFDRWPMTGWYAPRNRA